jgi:hypothetical protein
MSDIRALYERLRAMQWPVLARGVGDFALYESLLAGCADYVLGGGLIDVSRVPMPDEETVAHVKMLRAKVYQSREEAAFLEYFDLLEQIRSSFAGAQNRGLL